MSYEKFVIGTETGHRFANLVCRGMRFWRRVIIHGDYNFIVSSPKKGLRGGSRDLDFLENTFLTTDVWEALRVYQTVPRGNASLDVTFRLKETSWEWRTEPVDTVFGSSRRSSTVVKTSSKYQLLLPARIDGDVLEVAKAIYVRQPASEKQQ